MVRLRRIRQPQNPANTTTVAAVSGGVGQADAVFDALSRHDPRTVISAVDQRHSDNANGSTWVDAEWTGGRAFVTAVMVFGTASMVPARRPARTPGGRPTLHKRNKTEINDLYARALSSCVLTTVNEAFATAVAAVDVNVLVVRPGADTRLEPVYVGRFSREDPRITDRWSEPLTLVEGADGAQLLRRDQPGRSSPWERRRPPISSISSEC